MPENQPPRAVALYPDLSIAIAEAGEGRAALILHGGGGPFTVAGIAAHLSKSMRTILPTHPGWNGTPRPDWFNGVDDLALAYLHLLADRGLRDVVVIGSSLGGWIGAEMAVRDQADIVGGLVLINAAGIEVEGESIADVFSLDPRGLAKLSFHDPDRFFADPAAIPPEQLAMRRANMETLKIVGGTPSMRDPKLRRRLARVSLPTLVIWGESDRVVSPAYGAAYAKSFADARFETVARAGHLPQIEQPDATLALIEDYVANRKAAA